MKSLDTEATGLDLRHGAKPFMVGIGDGTENNCVWEWWVDPLTREPIISKEDKQEIRKVLAKEKKWVLQNPKFDFGALEAIDIYSLQWPKVFDTLLASHLLASNMAHDLTSLARQYLGVDILPFENRLKEATNKARTIARGKFPEWRISKKGLEEMPSAKEKVWKYDMWLPRHVARELNYVDDHPWWTLTIEYHGADLTTTYHLWEVMRDLLKKRGLWEIYLCRLKVLPVAQKMETRGITLSSERRTELVKTYTAESRKSASICTGIAKKMGYDLVLPKSGNNGSLLDFAFNKLKLPPVAKTPNGSPSLNKAAVGLYQSILEPNSKELQFIQELAAKRSRDTAINYAEGYERFWIPVAINHKTGAGWYRLHPSLNPTGSDTLRWSCSNPNEQNISKKKGFNLRYMFGPMPGREWWSLDASNIELRIPAYEAGETEMIELFERPDDPPYFGSYHVLIFDTLHPEKFAKVGVKCRDEYKSSWYQWVKNGNFAVQYGAQESSGTADKAYHVEGAQRRIQSRFTQISKLSQRCIEHAEEYGYVETMPDKTVCPDRGYPLLCTRTRWGGILPTVPLSYHIQGTAMWWMCKAMIRVQDYLDQVNGKLGKEEYFLIMQVHDELVFDFPVGKGKEPHKTNLPMIREIKKLMEMGGDDIGVPIPVGVDYNPNDWSTSMEIAV